ncbi:MAG: hypothetical protein ACK54L_02400, partial [Betaproteobacteria bacterium]
HAHLVALGVPAAQAAALLAADYAAAGARGRLPFLAKGVRSAADPAERAGLPRQRRRQRVPAAPLA